MSVKLIQGKFEEIDPAVIGRVDMVFADPPDNLKVDYESYSDDLPTSDYRKLLKQWLSKCCKVTSGPVIFCFNERWIPDMEDGIREYGLNLIQRNWWRYSFGQHNARRYTPVVRPAYWLNSETIFPDAIRVPSARQAVYGDKRAKAGGRMPESVWPVCGVLRSDECPSIEPTNVWDFSRICGTFREKRKWHKCQIPERLMEQIIKGHCQPGQTVLDPFVGSGTTVYAALATGRNVVGLDVSQFYLDQIEAEVARRGEAA